MRGWRKVEGKTDRKKGREKKEMRVSDETNKSKEVNGGTKQEKEKE